MARNKTLGYILDLYRSEARLSGNPAHHAEVRDTQVRLLQRVYEYLWEDKTWSHLRIERQYPVQQGERYYDFTPDFDVSRIDEMWVKDGDVWRPLRPEIRQCDYTSYDSDLGVESWPVSAWRLHEDETVEIWPVADRNGDVTTRDGYLKVVGTSQLPPFVDDSDICVLDDRMIALFAAAETLFPSNEKLGSIKMGMANARLAKLLGNLTKKRTTKLFAGSEPRSRGPSNYPVYRGEAV